MKYKLVDASFLDIDKLVEYKLNNIFMYAKNLDNDEINKINNYVSNNVPKQIDLYKIILVDGKKVGCLLLQEENDGILIDEIYLEENYRNNGIGSNIIKNVISDNDVVYLWVYKDNINAISLYGKLGFYVQFETDVRLYMKYERECEIK